MNSIILPTFQDVIDQAKHYVAKGLSQDEATRRAIVEIMSLTSQWPLETCQPSANSKSNWSLQSGNGYAGK